MPFQGDGGMTPTRSATPSNHDNVGSNDNYRVIRKRNRVPLSCAPCRNRKLKCNRSSPCENCVKRGDVSSCSYAAPGTRRKAHSKNSSSDSPDVMQNRIDRLEGLVLSIMTNGSQNLGPAAAMQTLDMGARTSLQDYDHNSGQYSDEMSRDGEGEGDGEGDSETDQVAKSLGVLRVANSRSFYVGESHWGAILNDISEVRNFYNEHKKGFDEHTAKLEATRKQSGQPNTGPVFLFGGRNLASLAELQASLPGRDAVDKMVTRYFNEYDTAMHILHPASWRKTYENHWTNPSQTDPAFLGQLFAICCLAMHSYHRSGREGEPYEYQGRTLSLASNYRQLTAQCLLLADYSKPLSLLIETMILHLHGEYTTSRDTDVGVWVYIGIIVRLAMRMGLHRDPRHYSSVTPFQGELRRRLWTHIRLSDLLFSFQIGLPSMIKLGDCDTELPRNIFDDEFDEDTKVLPPARPPTEVTPVSYMIGKASLAFTFGKIVERLHSLKNLPYEEVMELDEELRQGYASIPPFMRYKSLEDSLMDPIAALVIRFNTSMLYHKSQCVLHRRYLDRSRENSRYNHSRRTCMDSSMELLRYQVTLHTESHPGRRLHNMKWYISSLTTHDFLLAAALVCLDLFYSAQAEIRGRPTGDVEMWGTDRRVEMIEALKVSRDVWVEISDNSMEAYKAATTLTIMLKKLEEMHFQSEDRKALNAFRYSAINPSDNPPAIRYGPEEEKPEHSAAITLGMLSTGGVPPGQAPMFNGNAYPPVPGTTNSTASDILTPNYSIDQQTSSANCEPNPFSFLPNGNSSTMDPLDWDAWDSYVQSTSVDNVVDIWPNSSISPLQDLSVLDPQVRASIPLPPGAGRDIHMGVDTPPGTML